MFLGGDRLLAAEDPGVFTLPEAQKIASALHLKLLVKRLLPGHYQLTKALDISICTQFFTYFANYFTNLLQSQTFYQIFDVVVFDLAQREPQSSRKQNAEEKVYAQNQAALNAGALHRSRTNADMTQTQQITSSGKAGYHLFGAKDSPTGEPLTRSRLMNAKATVQYADLAIVLAVLDAMPPSRDLYPTSNDFFSIFELLPLLHDSSETLVS